MASSVSSERAFSQAGITISKRRNRLKSDIVEALQCLKCAIHRNLLFREAPSSADEGEGEGAGLGDGPDAEDAEEPVDSWDTVMLGSDDEGEEDSDVDLRLDVDDVSED